jgi:hypothetical protein
MGRAIPCLLAAVAVADAGARVLPIDPLTFRAWEALSRYRPPGTAFEPNRRYVRDRSYGDAAAMGNLSDLRQYRREAFTTDARGFRNAAAAHEDGIDAILAGDSFAVGSGVTDDATLSVMLSRALRCEVYNAGGMPPDPDRLRALAQDLGLTSGLVVHAQAEDAALPVIPSRAKRAINRHLAAAAAEVGRVAARVRGLAFVSPLRIAAERMFKQIADDRTLPNSYASTVVRATLRTGDPILFVGSKLAYVRSRREASAGYWVWLQSELARSRLGLVVVLVPSKYRVYRDLIVDLPPRDGEDTTFLDRLAQALGAAGIAVIDLTAPLKAEAMRRAARGEYVYWRDDIHWNRDGIHVAADTISRDPHVATGACGPQRTAAGSRSAAARN